jgi:hypothetical protein
VLVAQPSSVNANTIGVSSFMSGPVRMSDATKVYYSTAQAYGRPRVECTAGKRAGLLRI